MFDMALWFPVKMVVAALQSCVQRRKLAAAIPQVRTLSQLHPVSQRKWNYTPQELQTQRSMTINSLSTDTRIPVVGINFKFRKVHTQLGFM